MVIRAIVIIVFVVMYMTVILLRDENYTSRKMTFEFALWGTRAGSHIIEAGAIST